MARSKQNRAALLLLTFLAALIAAGCSGQQAKLEWHKADGYRWAELPVGFWGSATGFKKISPSRSNIRFLNNLSEADIVDNRNYLNGSGVAAGDVDGDGLVDLYFAQLDGPNTLYKNMGGFRFEDITERAGVSHLGHYSTGTALADVDGDGDLDLLVTSMSKQNMLYLNGGHGDFTASDSSGLGESHGSTTLALADVDGDSDLDLYIANYKKKSAKDLFGFEELAWENTVVRQDNSYKLVPPYDEHYTIIYGDEGPTKRENGSEDEFYLNDGTGSFEKVADPETLFRDQNGDPLGLPADWGLTAKFQDVNGDNLPDLYVCNDFWTPDRFWINRGDGTFRSIDPLAVRNYSFSSMGVDFSDINRDGHVDFFVTEMLSSRHERRMRQLASFSPVPIAIGEIHNQPQYMRNTLFLNRGDHTFAEIARFSGVEATEWSWATNFLDVDLDGYEDLIVNTGNTHDVLDLDTQEALNQQYFKSEEAMRGYILEYPPLRLQNKIYRNNRDLTFTEKSTEWGFLDKDVSHGLAMADLDNDGDLDLASNRLNETALILENETTAPRIAVRLIGSKPNTRAIGAKVTLEGGPVTQTKEISAGGNYLSSSEPIVVFAAAPNSDLHQLSVTWPGGYRTAIDSVAAGRMYEIEQDASRESSSGDLASAVADEPLFRDVSERIAFTHHESPYDENRLQPMLPVKLSRMGPGLSWIDFDRDDDDDLFIASGRGGATGIFENLADGNFSKRNLGPLSGQAPGDQTAVLGWQEYDNMKVIVGSSNYEQERTSVPSGYWYAIGEDNRIQQQVLPSSFSATGPMSAADYNGDGAPDLFIGGRVVPDNYPENATSRLFISRGGEVVPDSANSRTVQEIGLVTGSVFTDYDLDGDPDLLLSTEWGSLKLFRNNVGRFEEVTRSVGFDRHLGWWNGVATGDFNNDGRPDIVATNWGLNSEYRLDTGHPLKMYYGDFDRDRQLDIVEAYYDPEIGAYVPKRRLYELYESIKTIASNLQSHRDFSTSTIARILGANPESMSSREINTLAHTLFINRGDHFTAHPLPAETQFTTAFHAGVADFDNDGNEDLFLSQNVFALPRLISRQDAGRGLLLTGDGNGNLSPVPGWESGIKVYGEQRGAAFSDFNRDGKVDLAISQNGAPAKLYENRTKKSGLVVRLAGPPANPSGIGSSIRVVYPDGTKGPRREIQAGSGYWSQNSSVQVMGTSGEPSGIEVTWFDGTAANYKLAGDMNTHTFFFRRQTP